MANINKHFNFKPCLKKQLKFIKINKNTTTLYVQTYICSKIVRIEEAIKVKSFNNEYHKLIVNLQFTNSYLQELLIDWIRPHGLTIPQFNVLRILRGQHPKAASVTLIVDRMLDKSSNVSRLVEKLRVKDLLERNINKIDRRQVDVLINIKGLNLLSIIDETLVQIENHFKHLTENEAKTLNNLLDKFRDNILK